MNLLTRCTGLAGIFKLSVSFFVDCLLFSSERVIWRDVSDGTVESIPVVMICFTLR